MSSSFPLDDSVKEKVIVAYDQALSDKMLLVSNAIDDIGLTPYHWKLFFLNGFGYAVDSLLIVCSSIAQPQVELQYPRPNVIKGVSVAASVGMLIGAVFWGMGADLIGRRLAFNSSLFICSIFVIIAGAMPSYVSFCAMVAIYSAGSGGNYILDATTFLEFLPSKHAYLTTILAVWWGVGYTVTGLLAWAFMTNYSCESVQTCTYANNMGWRYLHYTAGSLVTVLAILRVTVIRMEQTPKWLITQGRDRELITVLDNLASKYDRSHSLTIEQLDKIGDIKFVKDKVDAGSNNKFLTQLRAMKTHLRGLFVTRKLAFGTVMLFLLWILIGIANPLYGIFRPYYLKTRGYAAGTVATPYITWRNYAISNICGLVGPFLAWPLLDTPFIRRRGTLAIGALLTMAFLFAYTQVKNGTQNFALACVISAVENIFFGGLYGITPELLPTASRGTGYGLAVAINRVCNICAAFIGSYANVETTAPLFICAALFGAMAFVSVLLPFEPSGRQSA
ncbi:major facilitator superfamily domain-containing protein [Lipomyces japonicus]|uniref:major facilitator superfamily domain-containing protein n=1 Tax=Lipomyces japonicus TaxID=56871 RepID=UPI0034CF093C